MDLKLDLNKTSSSYGDIVITNGDTPLVDGKLAILQDVLTALKTFKGECFMNTSIGIDYFGQILVKNPKQDVIDAILINAIVQVPGVTQLNKYGFASNFLTRQLTIAFELATVDGIVSYSGLI
jgi:hypothetical protein